MGFWRMTFYLEKKYWLFIPVLLLSHCLIFCAVSSEISNNEPETNLGAKFMKSYYAFKMLALHEKSIYEVLQIHNSTPGLSDRYGSMANYLEDYAESLISREQVQMVVQNYNSEEVIVAHNPVLSARMIFRYVVYLRPLVKNLTNLIGFGFNGKINAMTYEPTEKLNSISKEIDKTIGWPTQKSLDNIWESILTIQHFHDFSIAEIIHGKVFGPELKFGLNYQHCLEIGKYAISQVYFAYGIEWLENAKSLHPFAIGDGKSVSEHREKIEDLLTNAFKLHDLEWESTSDDNTKVFLQKLSVTPEPDLRVRRRTFWQRSESPNSDQIKYLRLCSGVELMSEKEKSKLFCWHDTFSNPTWVISPNKVERHSLSPGIIRFYDIIPNSLMAKLIDQNEPRVINSTITRGRFKAANHLVSSTWTDAPLTESPELRKIMKTFSLVSGLEVPSDFLFVFAYTFGNPVRVHADVDVVTGRISVGTMTFYLSDVEKGGETVFPHTGAKIKPIKGSAVFWMNLNENDEFDKTAEHGACPVIVGNKWAGQTWIRLQDQFLRRVCSLSANVSNEEKTAGYK